MSTNVEHARGEIDLTSLGPITASAAREFVLDCLVHAHGERFESARRELGQDSDAASVRRSVQSLMRVAFEQVGGSFDAPTREALTRVVNVLAERSLSWGTPPDTVFEHHAAATSLLWRIEGHIPN